ncbi:hypothetical protein PR001_g9988 [Phytophthora rubi]|uniref:Uncharacterized protein n=1 Tax=Phytophthora rubi TaxID=129364 RepID=A0A6A3MS20_9STRA|nr:hypothetical protein PR001_g9988 [Phytophthora rubi]
MRTTSAYLDADSISDIGVLDMSTAGSGCDNCSSYSHPVLLSALGILVWTALDLGPRIDPSDVREMSDVRCQLLVGHKTRDPELMPVQPPECPQASISNRDV